MSNILLINVYFRKDMCVAESVALLNGLPESIIIVFVQQTCQSVACAFKNLNAFEGAISAGESHSSPVILHRAEKC